MAGQVQHLQAWAACPAVTVQVVPMATPRPVICPAFTLLGFPGDPDVACMTGPGGPVLIRDCSRAEAMSGTFAALARAAMPAGESARLIGGLCESTASA
jgi:hypothetical protein